MTTEATEAPRDSPLCPRLVAYREDLRTSEPDWHNSPVDSFGLGKGRACDRLAESGIKDVDRLRRGLGAAVDPVWNLFHHGNGLSHAAESSVFESGCKNKNDMSFYF